MKEIDNAAVYEVDDGSNVAAVKSHYSDEHDVRYDALKGKHLGFGVVVVVDMRREKTARLYGQGDIVRATGDVGGYWRFDDNNHVELRVEPLGSTIHAHQSRGKTYIDHIDNREMVDAIDYKPSGYKDAPDTSEVLEVTACDLSFEEV